MSIKKRLLVSVLFPIVGFVVVFMNTGITHADPFARARWYGYFNNRLETSGTNLLPGGINVGDIDTFVNVYRNALNSGNIQLEVAASFTVLTMLGAPAGTWWGDGWTRFGEWEGTVRWYAANGRIGWADPYYFVYNTYYQRASTDVAWYLDTNTLPSIVFYNPNGSTYAIKRDCANPVGEMSPLQIPPPPPPPTNVQCGTMAVNANPRPEIGQPMSVTVTPRFSGGPPTPDVQGPTIHITGPGFNSIWGTPPVSIPPGPAGGTLTMNSPGFTPVNPGTYTVAWNLTVNGVGPVPSPCGGTFSTSFEVMRYPFIEVKGGDVFAGAGIITDPSQTCGTPINNTNAGVTSWNRNSGTYTGAGGQYATFAWNFIQEFNTAKASGRPPNYLSFSNQTATGQVNLGAGRYGGFGRPVSCVDQWKDVPPVRLVPNPAAVDINALDGTYYHNAGNLTIGANTINPGKKVTIYVAGDVRISGNIMYGGINPTWADVNQIPVFKLVVKGRIFIGNTVTRIDGNYIAVPDTPNYTSFLNSYTVPRAGTISTCSTNFSVINPAGGAGMINACNQRLEVNGSLSANQIFFLRTFGTMSSGVPAETINFNPETWLAPSSGKGIEPTYQSVVGLPPVL